MSRQINDLQKIIKNFRNYMDKLKKNIFSKIITIKKNNLYKIKYDIFDM